MPAQQSIREVKKANPVQPWKTACVTILLCLATAIAAPAQTFTTLASFSQSVSPVAPLTQGIDGNFYGVSLFGGGTQSFCPTGCGAIFKVTPTGTITVLHNFCTHASCLDGWVPASLTQGCDGNFYGVTVYGGANSLAGTCPNGCGTFFKVTLTGTFTTLYSFCSLANCADGYNPLSLMQSLNSGGGSVYGDFYGATTGGGANASGVAFRMTPKGVQTTLFSFDSGKFWSPLRLIQAAGGNFYGAAIFGTNGSDCLADDCGAIFRMTPNGTVTPLRIFDRPTQPIGPLVRGVDGDFYGMTADGGHIKGNCTSGCGTAFKVSAGGTFTSLYAFCSLTNCTDGIFPNGAFILASDGKLYGTTLGNGNDCPVKNSCPGTIFTITSSGAVTTLYNFCAGQPPNVACPDGSGSIGTLFQSTNGKFYGVTENGGSSNDGTIFSLDVGLAPFVTFLNSGGPVGKPVQILGQGFTGTTSVSFNGTPASFTVKSDTYLTTSVPAGATTGHVTVTTPGGTLSSNAEYRVTP